VTGLTIRFRLRDVHEIEPWRDKDSRSLGWFGLSDGCYCMETPAGRLLERSRPSEFAAGELWCDYQVARPFLARAEIWPSISDPIPIDIVDYFSAWHLQSGGPDDGCESSFYDACASWRDRYETSELYDDVALADAFDHAIGWWYGRRFDTFYLRSKPSLHFWRIGSDVHLAWDGVPEWPPAKVRLAFSFEAMRDSIAAFFRSFLAEMNERVALIERDGWTGKDCFVDLPKLVMAQEENEELAANNLWRVRATDWDLVRLSIRKFDGESFGDLA
jgi:hypothetical protein